MKRKNIIPIKTISKMIREDTNLRISFDATKRVCDYLEDLSERIIKKSNLLVLNKNKKTIKQEDIKLSYKQLKNN